MTHVPTPLRPTLGQALAAWQHDGFIEAEAAVTVIALARGCSTMSALLGRGALDRDMSARSSQPDQMTPDSPCELDVVANAIFAKALDEAPVALLVCEEREAPLRLREKAPLIVALDSINGATNVDTNAAVGTIFSILPNATSPKHLSKGCEQIAAGFVVYGPQTTLALTIGHGTSVFTLDRSAQNFELTAPGVKVPDFAGEFAINASNHWHWDDPIRTYVDDCLKGRDGPRACDNNMRWTGSFVAEIYRILVRGGIYLFPGDRRRGFGAGRLRLVCEANPIAWVIEQAGGRASTGTGRILDVAASSWHQRSPVVIGSRLNVEDVVRLYENPHGTLERSALFGRRGLFRV